MNAHRSTTPPPVAGHRRRRRRRRARRGRAGTRSLWTALAAAAVLLLAGGLAWQRQSPPPSGPAGSAAAPPAGSSSASSSPSAAAPSASDSPSPTGAAAEPSGEPAGPEHSPGPSAEGYPDVESIPLSGPGTFTVAGGEGAHVGGTGVMLTYRVEVEDGIAISAADVAEEVESVLGNPRGWIGDGQTGFRRVSDDTADFRVRLATPGTVDQICGEYGLDTGGEVNCRVGQDVMVNLKRWLLATEYYADDVTSYRALIINHEVGHFLGHGHEGCPGEGEPAPAMMQQIKGLHGCVTNVWPYDENGQPITGPSVP
ncbi:DUF3152 domain-containing protein [Allostreptomyces psammosilenae]|uniref:DUF3152 domain-containing protein n=1 Tax=Allostreptomyces psammosilenae TaxID=1892865 RepID=A0A852ZZY7_9ACTN|nr:DUF3152 domain-containing protein [Allostreptomyces psammosilenae]NYI07896.1 hypothetical protein [Allostreptomyces psammosilenae]